MEISETLKHLPHRPGVYQFFDKHGNVIYVGKAIDLARRVRSYFQKEQTGEWKISELRELTANVQTIETVSEFDALLLEAKLIRQYLPKYNVIARDDKSPVYVILTMSESLPKVIFARRTQLPQLAARRGDTIFGPFQSARTIRSLLRDLRSVIPFCTQKQRNGKPCFYTHLELCNPCPSVIAKLPEGVEKKERTRTYRKHLIELKHLLSGQSGQVLRFLERQMHGRAREHKFEQAAHTRNQIQALYNLLEKRYDPAVYLNGQGALDAYGKELADLLSVFRQYTPALKELTRIECIDISNILGKQATGSLVVLTDGRIDKTWYRRFRIKTVRGANDPAMIVEVLTRRLKHTEWPKPNLILVDGGKPQVRAATRVLRALNLSIPVAGLAKRREEIIIPLGSSFRTIRLSLASPALHVLERIRDEAHRFAITYHRHLRHEASLPSG